MRLLRPLLAGLVPCYLIGSLWAAGNHPVRKSGHTQAKQADPAIPWVSVLPSATDSDIKTFDVPHYVLVNRSIVVEHDEGLAADRHELLLWLPGTLPPGASGEGKGGASAFCELAAQVGYHVIILKYPNTESASVCQRDPRASAFEDFRNAIISGGASAHISVARSDSIENRLQKILLYLQRTRPDEHWDEFLSTGEIRWDAIAVAGHSQGGGHAALIGIHRQVRRVICTGAPKDYSIARHNSAAWLGQKSATPKNRFFAFNHVLDHQACSPAEQQQNLHVLGLDAYGPAVDVSSAPPPYAHSHNLTTDYPGTHLTSQEAHTSVMNPRNAEIFKNVWLYLLTERTD